MPRINRQRLAARIRAAGAREDARERGQAAINRMAAEYGVPVEDPAPIPPTYANYQNPAAVNEAFAQLLASPPRRSGRSVTQTQRVIESNEQQQSGRGRKKKQSSSSRPNRPRRQASTPTAPQQANPPAALEEATANPPPVIEEVTPPAVTEEAEAPEVVAQVPEEEREPFVHDESQEAEPQDEDVCLDQGVGLDQETIDILNARIAQSTRSRYNCMNIRFIRFLHDNCAAFPNVLNPDLMGAMIEADEIDSQRRTKSGKPSKKRDSNRDAITAFLMGIDQHNPNSFPINFDALSFNAFAAFLKTFKKTVTKRGAATSTEEDETVIETATVTIRLGAGSFSSACSALSHLFTECGVDKAATAASRNMWRKIALYLKGARRTNARERQEHGLRTSEGKDPMPYQAYVHLCKILAMSSDPEHIATHFFLTLEWNMVSRAENVVNQHMELFGVYNDALLVYVGPSKGDQEGSKHADHPWHIYSVPQEPAICPILAFGKYLVTHQHVLRGDSKVSHICTCCSLPIRY